MFRNHFDFDALRVAVKMARKNELGFGRPESSKVVSKPGLNPLAVLHRA